MKMFRLRAFALFFVLNIVALSTFDVNSKSPMISEGNATKKPEENLLKDTAILQWVDKITGKSKLIHANVGENTKHEQLNIKVSVCRTASDLEKPENKSFLEIWEFPPEQLPKKLFSGWMLSSSPALSTLISPRHNVWLMKCKNKKIHKN